MVCTTIDLDSNGEDVVIEKLRDAGVTVTLVKKRGKCGALGCHAESTRTSRVVAVGSDWVGGAERYTPTCSHHHT